MTLRSLLDKYMGWCPHFEEAIPIRSTPLFSELDIENGLLTYHLESMRDLVKKKEDGSYTLSEFGRAGLGLIQRVEEPVINMAHKRQSVLIKMLSITIIVILSFSVWSLYNNNESLKSELATQKYQVESLQSYIQTVIAAFSKQNITEAWIFGSGSYANLFSSISISPEELEGFPTVKAYVDYIDTKPGVYPLSSRRIDYFEGILFVSLLEKKNPIGISSWTSGSGKIYSFSLNISGNGYGINIAFGVRPILD
jgi:hypothetical protein